ncbi:hypothetical protein V1512DRAFT_266775 [Lipomyces arxii]|uniref:uncharacterized protein n=1 Tax=Lipomyces arxii TaxID=56418 RepID=UPI0034CD2529
MTSTEVAQEKHSNHGHIHIGLFHKLAKLLSSHEQHCLFRKGCVLAYSDEISTGPFNVNITSGQDITKHQLFEHEHKKQGKHGHHRHLSFNLLHKRKKTTVPLPDSILVTIFQYFAINTVLDLRLVNKQFERIIDTNIYDMVQTDLAQVEQLSKYWSSRSPLTERNVLAIVSSLSGYVKTYPCPTSPYTEVLRWIRKGEERLEPTAILVSFLQLLDVHTEDVRVPRPLVLNWGRIVTFYWKFVETEFGSAIPFYSQESRFLKVSVESKPEIEGEVKAVDFSGLNTKDLLSLGVFALNVYAATSRTIPVHMLGLYEAAFALGPEYIAQWVQTMNIFVPKTTDIEDMRTIVVHRTRVALFELNISESGPSILKQLTDELERRDLMGVGEEVSLD